MLQGKGLQFYRRRKKVSMTMARSVLFLIVKILITLFVAYALVYCLGMRTTVVGASMESTLSDGDYVFVNRVIYAFSEPKAGDVIVFLPNGNEKSHYYVKRIVAVSGDTVQIIDGVLYVNGKMYDDGETESIETAGLAEEPITIGENEYFVLGDDRNNSEDSRYATIGNVSDAYIVGKVWFYFGSFSDMGLLRN